MELRTTTQTQIDFFLHQTRQQTDRLALLQQQAATGKRLLRPSDSPVAMTQVMAARSLHQRLQSSLDNARDARRILQLSSAALLEVQQIFTKARQLAIDGANSVHGAADYNALAQETDHLLERLVAVANSQENGRYLFAGTAVATVPFVAVSAAGGITEVLYQGGSEQATVPLTDQQTIAARYVGSEIFQGPASVDAFQSLIGLRDELRNTQGLSNSAQSQALSQRIANLQAVSERILLFLGEQSATLQELNSVETWLEDQQLETRSTQGELESADLAEVVVGLQSQENLFRLTLSSIARMFDQSLLDFIR